MIHVSGSFAVGIHFVSIGVYLFFFLCQARSVEENGRRTIHRKRLHNASSKGHTHGDHLNHVGEGVVVEGVPSGLSLDVQNRCVWMVSEQFCMEPGVQMGSFCISKQDLYIQQLSRDVGRNGYSSFAYGRALCPFS
ncbi:hypothetical protein BDL97_04G034100 [Sphagnum fallax]|nr:hypothetical protein BDL97_04G034100 [Sphagnum fallax]